MSIARIRILAIAVAVALAGSGVAMSLLQARTSDWKVGDVFVAIGKGKYEVRSSTGALKETINTGTNKDVAGCWFDSQFNLYTADIYNTRVLKHNLASPSHTQSVFANTVLQAPDGHSKSIVMAVNGDVYVGNAGNDNGSGTQNILRYRSDGTPLGALAPDTEGNGGIDWMDLATDQRTMFYTSRGRLIKRFNVGTNTQLGNFADLTSTTPTGQAFAIRLLGPSFNGSDGLLVADNVNIKRLNSSGAVVATWDRVASGNNNENAWQSLNLDPDGVHFWALGTSTGRLFRFSLNAPGDNTHDLGPISTDGNGTSAGLCVMGEPQTQIRPLALSNPTGATVLKDITAPFGNPAATGPSAQYAFSTWRLRIRVAANQPSIVAAVSFTPQSTTLSCPNSSDPNDFDCRFTATPAQCVPFFNDPSAPGELNSKDPHRCAYYRVKDMPVCSSSANGICAAPFAELLVPGSNDVQGEILMNLTNPLSSVFNVELLGYGPAPKGNPRLMRDPDSVNTGALANQFFIDATTAVIDWPAFGTGTPNDYSPVQRLPSVPGACAEIIKPDSGAQNSGSSIKIVVDVKSGPVVNGVCTGTPIENAATAPNNITLAIAGTGTNTALIIYCQHPSSNDCFTHTANGRYQANVQLDPTVIPPDTVNPYFFAVTSVNVVSSNPATQNPGIFPPVGRSYLIH